MSQVVERAWLARPSIEVAPELLGKLVKLGDRSGRIVEVEAYAGEFDPGSHAYRGFTPRTETMFGEAGHLYVYFTYGMHWCANVVCGQPGTASGVLLRALSPVTGIEEMRLARKAARFDRDLCNGPAKLCQALGINGSFDGADLLAGDKGVWLNDDGFRLSEPAVVSTRIGLTQGADFPWRWFIKGDRNVSRSSGRGGVVVGEELVRDH